MSKQNSIYFPNLNGLRFIAAFLVILHHLDQLYSISGRGDMWNNKVILSIGELGVKLFFVLSGFLITYLLLAEEKVTKSISIKNFYVRRILRIWPLYYIIILLSFFVFPRISFLSMPDLNVSNHLWYYFILFVFFLPNLVLNGFGVVVPYASQSWSVGVEEQFYLIWPVLMKFFKRKIMLFFYVVFIYLFMQYIGFRLIKHFIFWNQNMTVIRTFWNYFSIDCMAIGGLFAYMHFNKTLFLKYILNNYLFYSVLILTTYFILSDFHCLYFYSEIYAVLFGLIILNLACNKNLSNILEFKALNYLGKISYGLYMYHPLAIILSVRLFQYFGLLEYHVGILIVTFILTVLIAGLSYQLLEKKFISLKVRFSRIISGENVEVK